MNSFFVKHLQRFSTLPPSLRIMRVVTITGIALAVAMLFIALAIARGFNRSYKDALLHFHAHVILFFPSEHEQNENGFLQTLSMLDEKKEIRSVTRFLYREALAVSGGVIKGVVVKGVDLEKFLLRADLHQNMWDTMTPSTAARRLIVGEALARKLGITPEKPSLKLFIPSHSTSFFEEVRVVGTFSTGMYDYDSQFLLMPFEGLRELFQARQDETTGIEISLHDPDRAFSLAEKIRETADPFFEVMTWKELNSDLFAALLLEKWMLGIVMSLIVFVAALNIMTVVILSLLFRKKEITLLYALGLSRKRIVRMLTMSGLWTGGMGVAIGLSVGLVVSFILKTFPLIPLTEEVYFIRYLPLDISLLLWGFVGTFCFGISFFSSFFAAARLSLKETCHF